MNVFPIFKEDFEDNNELVNEILGYQVVDSKGMVISKGETPAEATERALAIMYLNESNPKTKIKLNKRIFIKKAI